MSISEKIYLLRTKNNLTQEDLANKLSVSHQSVQKWKELFFMNSGIACPWCGSLSTVEVLSIK